jgi:hypothetical protein
MTSLLHSVPRPLQKMFAGALARLADRLYAGPPVPPLFQTQVDTPLFKVVVQYGISWIGTGPRQSGLMWAARITLPHFSVSFPNSAGVIGMSSPLSAQILGCIVTSHVHWLNTPAA